MSKEKLAINAFTSYLRFLVSVVVSLWLVPFTISHVGATEYGLWALIFSILGFIGLIDLGFATAVVKYVAECRGAQDDERRNRVVSTLMAVYLVLALVAALGIWLLTFGFNQWFHIPSAQQSTAIALLWILGARSVLLNLPLSIFRGILFGEQKIFLINGIIAGVTVLYAIMAWWVLTSGWGLVALAGASLITMMIEHGFYAYFALGKIHNLRISWSRVDRGLLREVTSFSSYQLLFDITATILLQLDLIIVKGAFSLQEVAVYAVALKVATHGFFFVKQFVNALTPYVSELKGKEDVASIRQVILHCTNLALSPGVVLVTSFFFLGEDLIVWWVGEEFRFSSSLLTILMGAVTVGIPHLVAANVMAMTGHHRVAAWASFVAMGVNAVASILLLFPMGMLGVALGTVVSKVLVDWGYVIIRTLREYRISWGEYLRLAISPALLPVVVQGGILFLLRRAAWGGSFGVLFLEGLLGALAYFIVYWNYSLPEGVRERVQRRIWGDR